MSQLALCDIRCHHQTQGGEDDEIEKILSMQNLHPKLVLSNNNDLQSWCTASLDNPWTVGTYSFIQTTKTTELQLKVKYPLLLHFTRKALQSRQDTSPEAYLVHTTSHELHTTFEVQELDWLRGRKKTVKFGVRETGWGSTRKYKPWGDIVSGSNSHSNKAAGPRELKPEILGLAPGLLTSSLSPQTCFHCSSDQKQLLCLPELFTCELHQQLTGLLCENQMSHPGSLEALAL